jgi:hypothetical protein
MHYNYVLKPSCRKDIDYKVISLEAWEFLKRTFGGMEFRRFTTHTKQSNQFDILYIKIRVMVVQERCLLGFQIF